MVIFLLGFFWKKATAHSALTAAISSAVLSYLLMKFWPELPFMDRVGVVFIACTVLAVLVTLIENAGEQPKAIDLDNIDYRTTSSFNIASLAVVLILIALYTTWW